MSALLSEALRRVPAWIQNSIRNLYLVLNTDDMFGRESFCWNWSILQQRMSVQVYVARESVSVGKDEVVSGRQVG